MEASCRPSPVRLRLPSAVEELAVQPTTHQGMRVADGGGGLRHRAWRVVFDRSASAVAALFADGFESSGTAFWWLHRGARMTLLSRLLAAVLAATCLPGCSSAGVQRSEELVFSLRLLSEAGQPLARHPVLVTADFLFIDPESRVQLTDGNGWLEVVDRRESKWPFAAVPIRTYEVVRIYLPQVHSEGVYTIGFVLDPSNPAWRVVARDAVLESPVSIEATTGPGPAERMRHRAHGSVYHSHTGEYVISEILADGQDRRRVPMIQMPYGIGQVPREPMLEVSAEIAPLVGRRGNRLEIFARLLDPPLETRRRLQALDTLRLHLDRLDAARASAELDALDPRLLVGMSQRELIRALGEPAVCDRAARDLPSAPRQMGPCRPGREMIFHFHLSRHGARGGGRELLLELDDDGTCVAARWRFTQ
ncbi:MAG: hypothetical protein DWQ36_16400 [Acidobacteria bacterium]|nr:MAG: hypothetical protein DWQ30_16470 [Acidobacteriota bacterium]REK05385.1 MAG: hypothetical protein DWQ36_16400 [Acidobacteriota bacterium]